ncbi:MAG: hypothetical protein KDD38_09380, partial [Bdellovibrionales bacterium]|nr:hypothetical protein [Bdellovibrionales bacterium]
MKADEKIILDKSKFRVEYPQDQILVKSPSMSDLVIIRQDGVTIGSIKSLSFVVADSIEIEVTVDLLKNVSEPSAVLASLLKSLIGRIAFYGARRPVSLSLTVSDFDNENHYEVLHSFDFVRIKGEKYFLKIVPEQIEPLSIIKKKLRDLQSTSVQIGRGFITDSSEYSELSIDLLMTEYNDLAWGRTSWAKHSNIAADELSVIGANCLKSDKVLEIGAGSGRLTFELAKKCGLLTASDYIPEIID